MNDSRILITSAAGKTGMATAFELLERGFPVHALVRRDDHRAQRLRDAGAEILVGDMGDSGDMRRGPCRTSNAPTSVHLSQPTRCTTAWCSLRPPTKPVWRTSW